MVVNLWDANNTSPRLPLLGDQQEASQLPENTQIRDQLCAIQNTLSIQLSPQSIVPTGINPIPPSSFTQLETPALLNPYTTQATPTSILLAAQLLFGQAQTQENTPPQLTSASLLSPIQQMDTSQAFNGGPQNTNGTNGADTGSPSSSHSNSNDMNGGDAEGAEGVWSADIDQAFHEALQIYPPCGRRKIILSEEGKMYGRNELIARYIKIRCGKTRTRKQVSSHIQVLARKKNREMQSKYKTQEIKSEPSSSNFGSPKSAESLAPIVNQQQISPTAAATALSNPLFQQIKTEALTKTVDSLVGVSTASVTVAPPLLATGTPGCISLQWPFSGMFNNNFYGNVGINNDENLYANFAAALNAQQQQINAFGQVRSAANASNPLLSTLSSLPALEILPNLPLAAGNPLFTAAANGGIDTMAANKISSSKLTLCGFTAYVERSERIDIVKIPPIVDEPLENIRFDSIRSKFPELLDDLFRQGPSDAFFLVKCWANVSFDVDSVGNDSNALYAVDSFYDSPHNFDISISSKVCSFGKQVVEKVEVYSANEEDQARNIQSSSSSAGLLYHYRLEKSPMCEYMVVFIRELKKLEISEMNCVLENFTILQVVTNKQTDEILMVIAFNFEVSPEPESNCRVFRIVA